MSNNIWVVLLGAPGSGKGTQAEYLVSEKGFVSVSVGEMLRNNKSKPIMSGEKTIGDIMDKGELLPNEVVFDLVRSELAEIDSIASRDVLFDGFPRTVVQAEIFDDFANGLGKSIDHVLNFVVDDDVILKRVLGRYKCSKCGKIYNDFFLAPENEGVCDVCGSSQFSRRVDDNEEALKMRVLEYNKETSPLIEFYSNYGVLKRIDADVGFDDVKGAVLKILNKESK
ncbi:MAG: nucleoside monophosphate kinase [Holosporales bacterium]|jgi:adenylate kinase|nr:nucleoside monophosphate kinase [Holosporales bacterium]